MQVFRRPAELTDAMGDFGLALGVFDGVHLGHQAVIDAVRGFPKLGVLTFDPHPVQILAPDKAPRRVLSGLEHKKLILERLGVDFMVVVEFSREFAAREACDFAGELFGSGARRLTAGEDWSFGRGREGTMERLAAWGRENGVDVVGVTAVESGGERISSTRIRACLEENDLNGARELLGRPYSVFGEVRKGKQLGRTIGFPTANVSAGEEFLPENGVYLVEGNGTRGVANIGTRPTVDDSPRRSLEVHLFSDDIPMTYGWQLEVAFLRKLRDEQKFDSIDDLKAQIARDVALGRVADD